MKLLKKLFRKEVLTAGQQEALGLTGPGQAKQLDFYAGMRVEVTTEEGRLLFVAKLMSLRGDCGELHPYSKAAVTPGEEPIHVFIRGYNDREQHAVCMQGSISPRQDGNWHAQALAVVRAGNDRAFFRVKTDMDAQIVTVGVGGSSELPCKMLDISIGGTRIGAAKEFHEGDSFMFRVQMAADRPSSIALCQVVHVISAKNGWFEYGCKFLGLNESEQEKLAQYVFEAQRRKTGVPGR